MAGIVEEIVEKEGGREEGEREGESEGGESEEEGVVYYDLEEEGQLEAQSAQHGVFVKFVLHILNQQAVNQQTAQTHDHNLAQYQKVVQKILHYYQLQVTRHQ